LARRAKHLTTQARVAGSEYWHDDIGYNYRLTNLGAALGLAQLEQLPEFLKRKRAIAKTYDDSLGNVRGIDLPPRARWADPSMWLYSIRIDSQHFGIDRKQLHQEMKATQIETRPLWPPVHKMPVYSSAQFLGGQVAEEIFSGGLSLPCSVGLSQLEQANVIQRLKACSAVSRVEANRTA